MILDDLPLTYVDLFLGWQVWCYNIFSYNSIHIMKKKKNSADYNLKEINKIPLN
jgi:hypothetical protein